MAAAHASAAKGPAFAAPAMRGMASPQARAGTGFAPPLASLAAIPARPAVQRKCGGCEAEERDETPVRARLEVGPVGDRYEREADAIAGDVMAMRSGEAGAAAPAVQRACAACGSDDEPRPRRTPLAEALKDEEDAPVRALRALASGAAPFVQRACAARASDDEPQARRTPLAEALKDEDAPVRRACSACSSPEEPKARRAPADEAEQDEAGSVRASRAEGGPETIAASERDLTSGGSALPGATRSFFEQRMGRDLSGVRVHEGGGARALNSSIAARAFTYRNHVWLGGGESAGPSFTMAHELAHVMQQTAPGPIGPGPQRREEASAGGPRIRRINCDDPKGHNLFFAPVTKTKQKAAHDTWLTEITKLDTTIIGEVPVPNAKGNASACNMLEPAEFGRADLVRSKNGKFVGMGYKENKTETNAPRPWSSPDMVKMGCAGGQGRLDPVPLHFFSKLTIEGKKRAGKLSSDAAPTWGGKDYEKTGADASTDIAIGDVKFGGTPSARRGAAAQIRHYLAGIDFVNKGYNIVRDDLAVGGGTGANELEAARPAAAPPAWNLKTKLMSDWAGPKGWQTLESGVKLVIARWHEDSDGNWEARRCDGTKFYDGKLFGAHDSSLKHVWLYVWYPDSMPPKHDYEGSAVYRGYRGTATSLMNELRAPPGAKATAAPAQGRLFPRRIPGEAPPRSSAARAPAAPATAAAPAAPAAAASPAPSAVARKPVPKPIPKTDHFKENYEAWKTKRETLQKQFQPYSRKDEFGADLETLLFAGAVENTVDINSDNPNSRVKPDAGEKRKHAVSDLRILQILSGPAGKILGALRYRFGTFFLSMMTAFENLKTKFESMFSGKSTSKEGGITGAAIKVFTAIIAAVSRWMFPIITNALIECVQTGVRKKIDGWITGSPIEELETKFQSYLTEMEKLKDDVLGEVKDLLTSLFDPIIKTYETVKDEIQVILDIVGLAKKAFNAARAMACLAGGLETVGVACVISAADALLSLFDLSPSELLLASLLGTCAAQQIFGEAILAADMVKRLPKTIARKIVETIQPLLPKPIADLLCDPSTMDAIAVEVPRVDEVTCGAGGSDAGVPQGKDWVPPAGVDKAILNRPATPEEIAKYGRLDLPGATAAIPPAPVQPPAAPGGTPGATPPSGTGASEGEDEGEGPEHSVRPGTIEHPDRKVNVNYSIHGIGGGFSVGPQNKTKPRTVYVTARDSDGNSYGPDKVDILASSVYEDPARKGVYRIKFEPAQDYVLTSGTRALGFVRRERDAQVGARM